MSDAVDVPNTACSLFVAKAFKGGRPNKRSTGVTIKPPPPAIESINPAIKAEQKIIKYKDKSVSIIRYRLLSSLLLSKRKYNISYSSKIE